MFGIMYKYTITITDISDGDKCAFKAVIHELNNSIAMGDSLAELFDGIRMTIETFKNEAR